MNIEIKIFKGKTFSGSEVEGQLLIVENHCCIIPIENHYNNDYEPILEFDGHHLRQNIDKPIWVDKESVEFVRNETINIL